MDLDDTAEEKQLSLLRLWESAMISHLRRNGLWSPFAPK